MAIVLFDMEIGSMIQQPVEQVCAFLPGHPVELDVEWALLVREASVERRARLVARLRNWSFLRLSTQRTQCDD